MKFEWTEEQIQILRERYENDGPKVLAKEFGITNFAITAKARRLGIGRTRKCPPKDFKWTKEMVAAVKERYTEESAYNLAEEFGVVLNTVRRQAYRLGVSTIAGHAKAGYERALKSESCDIHYFDQWQPNMAYILGFLFADGSISKELTDLRICISTKDESILDFIKKELKSKAKIRRADANIDNRGSFTQSQSILVVCSTIMIQSLVKLGLNPRKTYNDDPFPLVPDDMMPHFVRGYLDGDGTTCISSKDVCTVGFVGSPQFITGLRDYLVHSVNILDKPIFIRGKNTEWATISWSAIKDIKLFFEFVYSKEFEFCLERKRQNLVKWLSKPRVGRGCYIRGLSK